MAEKKQEPVYDAAGTHVHLHNAETGGDWWCPVDAVDDALAHPLASWEYSAPVDDALEGLVDEDTAPKKKAAKKAATPGD